MAEYGYALMSEYHTAPELVRCAQRAEDAGFSFALLSDHFHPWVSEQGQSPFAWSTLGAIAQATTTLRLGTGVTCPTVRIHPAIVAQAAATVAQLMPGRFFLGVGTGENLNEHITGERWPPFDIRIDMLIEAIDIIRVLWEGETVSHWGDYYVVEDARIFSLPEDLPDIMVAGSGPSSVEVAGRIGDGYIGLAPDKESIDLFNNSGGQGKPTIGQIAIGWAPSEQEAKETIHKLWPNKGLTGELPAELRTVAHFEQAVQVVTADEVVRNLSLGPDPQVHLDAIQKYVDAGYTQIYIHQIGRNQDAFFDFFEKELRPNLS